MSTSISASAPGSLMLLGEHAVLHGRKALVAAVSQRIRATLTPRSDDEIHVSSVLGEFVTRRSKVEIYVPLRFTLMAIELRAPGLPSGFNLNIESDFSDRIGFGSSAAVTVATLAALHQWQTGKAPANDIFRDGVTVIRRVQGVGSGADVAASTYGNIVAYRAEPVEIQVIPARHPIAAVYSGSKMATAEVIRFVDSRRQHYPQMFENIFDLMENSTAAAIAAIGRGDWTAVGTIMNFCHGLMDAMGVSNNTLSAIVYALRAEPGILGSKISGSGLGDCAIGLGTVSRKDFPYPVMAVDIAAEGVIVESR